MATVGAFLLFCLPVIVFFFLIYLILTKNVAIHTVLLSIQVLSIAAYSYYAFGARRDEELIAPTLLWLLVSLVNSFIIFVASLTRYWRQIH